MYLYATEYMELTLEIHVVFYISENINLNLLKKYIFFAKMLFGTSIAGT